MNICDYISVEQTELIAADRISREYTNESLYLLHNGN